MNSAPFNLSINQPDILKLHVRLSCRDNVLPEYFTQHLGVFAANSNFPTFDNCFSGDTHFHSEFTDNLYEYGATVKAISKAASALGSDWMTITDHSCDLPPVGVGFQTLQDSSVSDGPLLILDIDMNSDGMIDANFGSSAHIGEENVCNYMVIYFNKIKIFLRWKNTLEFGRTIKKFFLHYITKDSVIEFLLNGHFGIDESIEGASWFSLKDLEN